jgi:polyisoprenoid-binding protein YceI
MHANSLVRIAAPILGLISIVAGLLIFNQTSSAQRSRLQPKTRIYTIDPASSRIIVQLTQEGFLAKLRPRNEVVIKDFNGKIQVAQNDESDIAVVLESEVNSLTNVDKDMSEFERKEFHNVLHNVVLESEKFPTIKFASISVTDVLGSNEGRTFTLNGDLTIREVTRRVAVPLSVTIRDQELRATGEGRIKQSEFGIKPYTGGLGAIKIADEVKVNFVIVAKIS